VEVFSISVAWAGNVRNCQLGKMVSIAEKLNSPEFIKLLLLVVHLCHLNKERAERRLTASHPFSFVLACSDFFRVKNRSLTKRGEYFIGQWILLGVKACSFTLPS
jgi:hypothetical protein